MERSHLTSCVKPHVVGKERTSEAEKKKSTSKATTRIVTFLIQSSFTHHDATPKVSGFNA